MSIELEADGFAASRGHIYAVVRALEDSVLIFTDRIALDRAEDRRSFARAVSKLRPGPEDTAIERQLLDFYAQAAARLAEETPASDADASASYAPSQSQATRIVELAADLQLFHSPDGEAYATLAVAGHHETWRLGQRAVKDYLSRLYYQRHQATPNAQAVADALSTLRGKALYDGPEFSVFVRIAELGGVTYLDLVDGTWRVVEITAHGWRVIADPPVKFRRSRGMLPLPVPVPGGSLDELRPFINVAEDDDFRLLVTHIVAALRARGPYTILAIHAEQGGGKTTTARICRALVDPNIAPARALPRDERDLAISASNGWLMSFDNLSHLSPSMSDALCRLATGGGLSQRELYADAEEVLFDATRPIILNGIEEVGLRPDLQDRSILIYQPTIPEHQRRTEKRLWTAFEAARARILGALLDAVVTSLRNEPDVNPDGLPRVADFAICGAAAAPALGWTADQFLTAYANNRRSSTDLPLDASPLTQPLRSLVDLDNPWQGSVGDLLAKLTTLVDEKIARSKAWPTDATRLSGALRRLAPALRQCGIAIEFPPRSGAGRVIRISTIPPHNPTGTPYSNDAEPASSASRRHADSDASSGGSDETVETPPESPPPDDADDASDAVFPRSSNGRVYGSVLDPPYELITEQSRLRELLPTLLAAPRLGLDCETTGLDPHSHRIRLVQLATPDRVYLVDLFRVDGRSLAPVLSASQQFILQNGKFDLKLLTVAGLPVPTGAQLFDTMLAAQLLGAGTADGQLFACGLKRLVERYLTLELDKSEQTADWTGELSDAMLRYAARDAAVLLPLADHLQRELAGAALLPVLELEMRALPAIAWLELTGAPFDTERWEVLAAAAANELRRIDSDLTALAGTGNLLGTSSINWDSPAQIKKLLLARGHQIARTDEGTLQSLMGVEPLAALLLARREAARKVSSYGANFAAKHVHAATGRIHADFLQLGAASGRMACSRPNLQNIPRDPAYRACFRPADDRVLVKADYSQIELRIAAELAPDETMLAAYQRGEDLHRVTAASVLGRNNGEVRPEDRQAAKALNFGLLYGMGASGLREYAASTFGVELTAQEAERFRTRYFATYPGLRRWHRGQPNGVVATRTLAGRRRLEVAKFTEKLNTPVQGTGADGLKLALALFWERRDQCPDAVPVLCVHDEIVVEVPSEQAEVAKAWLTAAMVDGMDSIVKRVPVEVETSIGRDWSGG